MKIEKLHNLKNKAGDIILLNQENKIIKIKNKARKTIVKIDYRLQPAETIRILKEKGFIGRCDAKNKNRVAELQNNI